MRFGRHRRIQAERKLPKVIESSGVLDAATVLLQDSNEAKRHMFQATLLSRKWWV